MNCIEADTSMDEVIANLEDIAFIINQQTDINKKLTECIIVLDENMDKIKLKLKALEKRIADNV